LRWGLVSAIENKAMDLEYAEKYLFNPYSLNKLIEAKADDMLIEIVHLGTELEVVKSLLPDRLNDEILDLKCKIVKYISNNRIGIDDINRILKDDSIDKI